MKNILKMLEVSETIEDFKPDDTKYFLFENQCFNDLIYMLDQKNGFYLFGKALRVFPKTAEAYPMSLQRWNQDDLWKKYYPKLRLNEITFFAEDIFGHQFGIKNNQIVFFDPEVGAMEVIASSLDEWCSLVLSEREYWTGYPLAISWQKKYGSLFEDQRLIPRTPFFCGGEFTLQNLKAENTIKAMKIRGEFHHLTSELPDGTTVSIKVD